MKRQKKKPQDYTLEDCINELNKLHIKFCRGTQKINSIIFYDIVPHLQRISEITDIMENVNNGKA